MHPLNCPHCAQPCLTFWAKTSIGPARSKPCASCGWLVSVHWLPSIVLQLLSGFAAFLGGAALVSLFAPLPPGWFSLVFAVGMLAGSVPVLWLYYRFVPLVARAT